MREIKIRAWNVNKKIFNNDYFIKSGNSLGSIECVNSEMENFHYMELKNGEFIFILNTGLKDSRGVEGFHKDIVRDFRGGLYIIEWDKCYGTFVLKEKNNDSYLPIYFLQYGEILGSSLMF